MIYDSKYAEKDSYAEVNSYINKERYWMQEIFLTQEWTALSRVQDFFEVARGPSAGLRLRWKTLSTARDGLRIFLSLRIF